MAEVLTADTAPWCAEVNGGECVTFQTRGTTYVGAVAALPALLGISPEMFPLLVKIWVPRLVAAGYGPYHYWIEEIGGKVFTVTAATAAVSIGDALRVLFQKAGDTK